MPSLSNIPRAWKSWWDTLNELSDRSDIDKDRLKEFIKKPPRQSEISTFAATDMTPTDVNEFFGLSELSGWEAWQFARPLIALTPEFETWLNTFEELTTSSKPTEARARGKIHALHITVYEDLKARGWLEDGPKVTLQFETALDWGPITYQNKLHKCVGKADYSMFFGERHHTACHLVVFEAKQDHGASTSNHGQILAYIAMVQASRKARGQTDSTVWGALRDGKWFYFFRLNNGGQWSCVPYTVRSDGWAAIANIIASMILRGHETAASPLRSSLSSNSSRAPRISSLNIAAVLDGQMFSAGH
ncbi:hypothetical protein N7465_008947 [Penicillium sp. CMV-2018d]|nr:hypothetical protein N7465_008947 [Penicillium sp. CMV-2018d]